MPSRLLLLWLLWLLLPERVAAQALRFSVLTKADSAAISKATWATVHEFLADERGTERVFNQLDHINHQWHLGYEGQRLLAVATKQELLLLTHHPAKSIQCYAFQCLSQYDDPIVFAVLKEHL